MGQTEDKSKVLANKYLEEDNHCPDRGYKNCHTCDYYLHCMEAVISNIIVP